MCTGQCSRCIGLSLYPLAIISILCNILLFFPGWDVKYAEDDHITEEVKYMGGVVGGGLMVLVPAIYIHMTGSQGCCANRCGMFLSIVFAAVGVAGALYSFIVAVLGLKNGPYCKVLGLIWTTPFKDKEDSYLSDHDMWGLCLAPDNVVEFNVGLFSTLLVTSGLQLVLCGFQMINGLFGCLCGTCAQKGRAFPHLYYQWICAFCFPQQYRYGVIPMSYVPPGHEEGPMFPPGHEEGPMFPRVMKRVLCSPGS
ncbi:hypothetical protein NHX12_010768 [Muraenolepis orangiensis]|uniref:Uncharacterized protein n=1 Tax=Muraenolepis orangiensis TaxID=630683 RepID=A0A9Q0DKA0_9TELE|nr:hypothetical protein NHX12_010768 [Muraenolepis orangiensis]